MARRSTITSSRARAPQRPSDDGRPVRAIVSQTDLGFAPLHRRRELSSFSRPPPRPAPPAWPTGNGVRHKACRTSDGHAVGRPRAGAPPRPRPPRRAGPTEAREQLVVPRSCHVVVGTPVVFAVEDRVHRVERLPRARSLEELDRDHDRIGVDREIASVEREAWRDELTNSSASSSPSQHQPSLNAAASSNFALRRAASTSGVILRSTRLSSGRAPYDAALRDGTEPARDLQRHSSLG